MLLAASETHAQQAPAPARPAGQAPAPRTAPPAPAPAATPAPPPVPFQDGLKYAYVRIDRIAAESGAGRVLNERVKALNDQKVRELNDKNKAIGDPQSIDEVVTKGPQLQDAFQSAIDEVENLNPPDELKDAHERFVSLGKQIHSKIDDLIAAAKKKDLAKAQQIGATIDPLNTESNEIARTKLGAPACDQG